MDPTKNEKLKLWKKKPPHTTDIMTPTNNVIQSSSVTPTASAKPISAAPANSLTQPNSETPTNIETPHSNVTPANIVTQTSSVIPAKFVTPNTQTESLLPDVSLILPVCLPPPDIMLHESGISKQAIRRGKRSTVLSSKGRRIKKCGLPSCLPCSFETNCGKCPQCLNKKMK